MPDVLLVEDEPAVAQVVEDALVLAGLSVSVAASDEAAYAKLETDAEVFAALVADIDLGFGTTGFDVARFARKLNPDVKVVYISAYAAYLRRFGVEGSLMFAKPFDIDEFAERVSRLVAAAD
jgi:CheY-like chemotaxis protein